MKEQILDAIIAQLEQNTKSLDVNIDTLDTSADLDENATIDPDDHSQQSEAKDMTQRLQQPIINLENAINELKTYKNLERSIVEQGAVVETDNGTLVIGVSIAPMDLDGKKIIGISEVAPIYSQINGKKAGETLQIGNKEYKILSIS